MNKLKLRTGDTVEVITGKDKGSRGEIKRVYRKERRILVSGINVRKKHQKPRQTGGRQQAQGGIIELEMPIDISNVMLVCPHTDKPTRVGIRRDEDGKPIRVSKASGKDID